MKTKTVDCRKYWAAIAAYLNFLTDKAEHYDLLSQEEFHELKARVMDLSKVFLSGSASERVERFLEDRDNAFVAFVHSGNPAFTRRVHYYSPMQEDMDIVAHSLVLDMAMNLSSVETRDEFVSELDTFLSERYPACRDVYWHHFLKELEEKELLVVIEPKQESVV